MSFDAVSLYRLLPSIYRIRDGAQAEPLKRGPLEELFAIIAEQIEILEDNIHQRYEDHFIETCAEWVVPYIGDLIEARTLEEAGSTASDRAQVANTIKYRRRKGTASMLEQLARDTTGWPAKVVEFFELLATTQYMNHLRPRNLSFIDVRDATALETLNLAFDGLAHNGEVRRIAPRRGRYNIPNVGIFLWRLGAFSRTDCEPSRVDASRFRFDPLGMDLPLFIDAQSEADISELARPENVAGPLTRTLLRLDLEDVQTSPPAQTVYYDTSVLLNVDGTDVPPTDIKVCDLRDFNAGWGYTINNKYAVDPQLGRIVVPPTFPLNGKLRVTFHQGFGDAIGGGEYSRLTTFFTNANFTVDVPDAQPSIQNGITAASTQLQAGAARAVVQVTRNNIFSETPSIAIAPGKEIELRAAEAARPVVSPAGDVVVSGGDNSVVSINGLVLNGGRIRVPQALSPGTNGLARLVLRHCTLVPDPTRVLNAPQPATTPVLIIETPDVSVEIDRCILGSIRAVPGAKVRITNSIIDAGDPGQIAYGSIAGSFGAQLDVENTTIIGQVLTRRLEASNTIFYATRTMASPVPVSTERLQEGCVRFSFVPLGSKVPRRYHCQPAATDPDEPRVRPVLTSRRYGNPAYCQLSMRCPIEIKEGADDRAEMGVFHDLYEPQREANLRARLEEYLRFGLEAGIFYAT